MLDEWQSAAMTTVSTVPWVVGAQMFIRLQSDSTNLLDAAMVGMSIGALVSTFAETIAPNAKKHSDGTKVAVITGSVALGALTSPVIYLIRGR